MFKYPAGKMKQIPLPTISRLCRLYSLIEEFEVEEKKTVSSTELGERLGVASHNIRKDITYIGETGIVGAGYEISRLRKNLDDTFRLDREVKTCIIGLNDLGTAIINGKNILAENYEIVAGFDSSINRIETIRTEVPVFPSYEIETVIKRMNIDFAIITASGHDAQKSLDRLIDGGIRGIINFSPTFLSSERGDVYIRNIDIIGEFRYLMALVHLEQ